MRKLLFAFLLFSIPALPQAVQHPIPRQTTSPPLPPQRQTTPPTLPPDLGIQADSEKLHPQSEKQKGCQELGEALKERLGHQEQNPRYTIAEYNAYQAAKSETNLQKQINELLEFVTKFPNSSLLPYINQLYLAACGHSGDQQPREQRVEQSQEDSNEAKRYAMFAGNAWPGQAGLTRLAQPCGAPPYASSSPNSFDSIEGIARDLESIRRSWGMTQSVYIVPLGSSIVNAWTLNSSSGSVGSRNVALICLPFGIQNIFGGNRDELEALIAHEMGHAIDTECYNYARRSVAGQRSCEARADAYAFAALVELHRDPYAMGGMFGRLEMFYGDISTGILARLSNVLGGNHPITPDRIGSMRNLLVQYARTHQTSLPPAVP